MPAVNKKSTFSGAFLWPASKFYPPGIDSPRWVWYLTSTFILMREINQKNFRQLNRFYDLVQVFLSLHNV
jgi:hypothetical protein